MFDDWIKIGDVMSYESEHDPSTISIIVVVGVWDSCLGLFWFDDFEGRINITTIIEPAEHPGWNKRSYWKAGGWKFL